MRETEEFQKKLKLMSDLMDPEDYGMAAPQVNWRIRLFALTRNEKLEKVEPQFFLNPKILKKSPKKSRLVEGCVSFPGLFLKIVRPSWVLWEYEDLQGKKHQLKSTGYYGRAVQHEIDHLNGQLFVYKAPLSYRSEIKRWLKGEYCGDLNCIECKERDKNKGCASGDCDHDHGKNYIVQEW